MKLMNKFVLCAATVAAFGANAAAHNYTRAGEVEQTIEIPQTLQLEAIPKYQYNNGKASGGTIVRTTDSSNANLYIGVGPDSTSPTNLKIVDGTGALTLVASLGCGNAAVGNLDNAAGLPGQNTAAALCESAPSISTVVKGMEPASPKPGKYTFTQEYGTFAD
ncbi:hypothetical protein CXJ71_004607 [Escherichia coli]|nr:hypothetical protein [Escherichia coli]